MADQDQTPPTPVQRARDNAIDALRAIEQAMYNVGYDMGFTAGWDACVRRFTATLSEAEQKPPERPTPPTQPKAPSVSYANQRQSNADLVLEAITESPGMKGHELVAYCDNTAFTIPERTVRTCLHRLKKAEKIENIDGRWYTREAAAQLVVDKAMQTTED